MKKCILPILVSIVFASCSKKETTEETTPVDSLATKQSADSTVSTVSIPEWTKDKTSTLFQTKNDTLYVTNFFATWCGPCIKEIPHFKEKIAELKGKPVKFTFVNLDQKEDWKDTVSDFVDLHGIRANTVLLDLETLDGDFFHKNFKEWQGESIPFTFFRKGENTKEVVGTMTGEQLTQELNSFN